MSKAWVWKCWKRDCTALEPGVPKGRLGEEKGGLVWGDRWISAFGGGEEGWREGKGEGVASVMQGEKDILSMVCRDEESPRDRERGDGAEA